MKTVGIFPASGGLGTSTYTHLVKLIPPHLIILICRHPEKIPQEYIDSGVRVREASYGASEEELKEAFADVDVLFLISFPSHLREYRVKVSTTVAIFCRILTHLSRPTLHPPTSNHLSHLRMAPGLPPYLHTRLPTTCLTSRNPTTTPILSRLAFLNILPCKHPVYLSTTCDIILFPLHT